MFVNLNIPSFDELLRKCVYSFNSRIQDSCNSLVNGIVKSSVPLFSRIWTWAPTGRGQEGALAPLPLGNSKIWGPQG